MEGKIVSYERNFWAAFLILTLVQLTSAEKLTSEVLLPKKALGCPYYGEYCDLVNWCCPGTECSNSYTGGTCVDDPFKSCKGLGESCGFFDAKCCGKNVCTATWSGGECQAPGYFIEDISNKVMGRNFI